MLNLATLQRICCNWR